MVFAAVLLSLASVALGALPPSGGPYFIQNPQSALVVDDNGGIPKPGNPIISFPVNPTPTSNQQWFAKQLGSLGPSGIFQFTCVNPVIELYVNGLPGNPFNAQNFGSPLNVTEQRPGIYSILFPWTSLALTTTGRAGDPLTLQPFNAINPLQQWIFSPASGGGVSSGSPTFAPGPSTTFFSKATGV
ncbi:hypothetical protein AURDEDRAFT_110306 [Auricularia subglabra TFB-10046 SS5]|nr:hypothetical protein AURDEDRAFT_110306 [Auricularia subglabra TFB-10046 SS5]